MDVKDNSDAFKREIESRRIKYLIHFTPTINLYSIFEQRKLYSREILESLDIQSCDILDYVKFTDEFRYDDKSYINLSLSLPNTYLLSKFRERAVDDVTIQWCILKIDPKHIYDLNTLFSVTNAASKASKKQYGITGDIDKFRMLFSPELVVNTFSGSRRITRGNIGSEYPTDIQAEILVKDFIPIESIISVCFDTDMELAQAKAALREFDTSKLIIDHSIYSLKR